MKPDTRTVERLFERDVRYIVLGVRSGRGGCARLKGWLSWNVSIGFSTETAHSADTEQCFEADCSNGVPENATRPDVVTGRNDGRHYYSGSNMDWTGSMESRTFYTY